MVYVDTPSPWQNGTPEWNDDRFTVRWMTGYVSEQPSLRTEDRVSKYGYWAWEDRGEQTYPIYDGKPGMVHGACGEEFLTVTPGVRFADGDVADQVRVTTPARAREIGTRFAMVVSWNEWTTGEQPSVEVSKDIEPSVEHGDKYLKILKEEIRRFKSE